MVGYTPSLSTAVWVGTTDGQALENSSGAMIYGSGLPSDIWKDTMDGALEGTDVEKFPKPGAIGGQSGIPAYSRRHRPRRRRRRRARSSCRRSSCRRWS